jgi:acyl phosphate:glycerol-3-phosphate acyltransferase
LRTILIIAALSYLLGSIPFGYLLIRVFRGEDVRRSGSGNIGATNVSRKSPVLGALTLLLDAAKGTAAVALAHVVADHMAATPALEYMALGGLFAVLGHMFPVWLGFRGGKGVATGLGAFALIAPKAMLIAAAFFIVVVLISRYVSLGSMTAVAVFPIAASLIGHFHLSSRGLVLISLACLLILVKHRDNVRRLWAGTENRVGAKRA